MRQPTFLLVLVLVLAACGGGQPPAAESAAGAPAAAPADAAADATAPEAPAPAEAAAGSPQSGDDFAALLASADPKKGKVLFLQCRACHSLVPETEPGKIGPTLHGVIGRAAGAVPGFTYSEAVAKSGITWTGEKIDHWLERPSDFLPGNKMVFIGVQNPQDRAAIIAYIQEESAKPAAP